MNKGEEIINLALNIANQKGLLLETYKLVTKFKYNELDIDLITICKLEVLLNEKLLIVPTTKKEWRKIKLQKLNNIIKK